MNEQEEPPTAGRPPATSPGPWRVLRTRPVFRRLWIGALISALGDTLTWMALTWYVVERTGSGAAVGTLLLCFAVPAALTGGPIGKWLDSSQPRAIMLVDNILRAVLVAMIPALAWRGWLPLPTLYVLTALIGALSPATAVGVRLVTPRLVPDNELSGANAALSICEQSSVVAGPAIAGVLIAATGALSALLLDAVSFLAMAFALAAIPNLARTGETSGDTMAPLRELLRPAILAITLLSTLFYFSYGPTEAALPLFVKRNFHSDARGLGFLWSAVGIGSLIGSLATGWLSARGRIGTTLALIMCLWGVTEATFSFSPTLWHGVVCLLLGGIVWGPYMALKTTLMQRLVPESQLGAVLGLQGAILGPSMPLGTALGGLGLRHFSPSQVILYSGLACVVGGAIALLAPTLRRADQQA